MSVEEEEKKEKEEEEEEEAVDEAVMMMTAYRMCVTGVPEVTHCRQWNLLASSTQVCPTYATCDV